MAKEKANETSEALEVEGPEMEYVVRYKDAPGVRVISAEDWAGAGVPDHPTTRWDRHNKWTIKTADLGLNSEQMSRIILADRGFVVEPVPVEKPEG